MKIATIQFMPILKDKAYNLQHCSKLAVQAAQAGARLICFPELVTTGYSFMSRTDAALFAETLDSKGAAFSLFKSLAIRLNSYIVWGMMEQEVGTGDLYNSQVCVAPDGSWTSFQKINLWGNDFLWAKPGRSNPPIIEMRLSGKHPTDPPSALDKYTTKKLGMLVCRDIRDKKDDKWKDFYEKGDADIIALSANWGRGGFPSVSWMDFAKDNDCVLVISNRYGKEVNNDFGEGGVCVIWPDGKVACEGLIWDQDCVVIAEV